MPFDPHTAELVLIDDDPFMLRILTHMLAQLGYTHVVACESGQKALDQIAANRLAVDLILLDINMPGMDGVEFIRRLVDIRFGGSVILVSGEDIRILESVEKLIEARQLTVLGHLRKPAQLAQLAALISRLTPNMGLAGARQDNHNSYTAERLRVALTNGELVNYYQPKVALATSEVVGMECLVRWQHPDDGLVFPDQFIGLAADHGLMTELTRVVLSAAIRQTKGWWRAGFQLSISVNVSMDDLTSLDFPDMAVALANSVGVEPQLITLEVTEGQVMRKLSTVLDVLSRLRLKRFRLAVDDFGTGHSSLAQLRDLPFDELKIDRGFVHGAASDGTRRTICSASLRMAHQLRMDAVGEGIEDQADWDFLRNFGCDVGQGYFIARPMPASDVLDWVRAWDPGPCAARPVKP